MTAKTGLSALKRRTRAEVQQLVAEFVSSGMRRSEFCHSRDLNFSTLRGKRRRKAISSAGRLMPVVIGGEKIAEAARTELWAGRGAAGHAPDRGAS